MTLPSFDEYEMQCLRFLADRYGTSPGVAISPNELPEFDKRSQTAIRSVIEKFRQNGFVGKQIDARERFYVTQGVVDAVHQFDNPPTKDFWKEWREWWFKSRWRTGITAVFVLLPLVVTWIDMLKKIVKWISDGD